MHAELRINKLLFDGLHKSIWYLLCYQTRGRQKKLTFLAEMSTKVFSQTPPPHPLPQQTFPL